MRAVDIELRGGPHDGKQVRLLPAAGPLPETLVDFPGYTLSPQQVEPRRYTWTPQLGPGRRRRCTQHRNGKACSGGCPNRRDEP